MKWITALLSITLVCGAQEIPPENPKIVAFEPSLVTSEPSLSTQELSMPAPQIAIPIKRPLYAVGLSYLFPGLGHVYLGDMKTAGGLMSAMGTGIGLVPVTRKNEDFLFPNMVALSSIWHYGIYAAYRDVRILNQQSGYSYRMPMENASDLITAPFNYKVLRKPEVWGGILGSVAIATAALYYFFPNEAHIQISAASRHGSHLYPYVAFPVGIGEESYFRGFLQPVLSENSTPLGGLILSSLAFGAAHISNAQALEPEERTRYYAVSLPLITTLGAYFGWLAQKNNSLRECVAVHSWYDFAIFALSAAANSASTRGQSPVVVAIPLSF